MEKKLRHSRQRDEIYQYLLQTCDHPSAEMIYSALRPENPALSLGTVYRNLKLLEELGMIRRVTSHQGTERYDAICVDHAHFLCQRCGKLQDLGCCKTQALREAITLEKGYVLNKMDLTVSGLCPNCAE